jgi:nitroreductase
MHVDEALRTRISIRAYADRPVKRETLEEILDVARWAPSGGNLQPWKVIVVTGKEREAVSDLATEVLMNDPTGEADEAPVYPKPLWEPFRSRRYKIGEDMYALLGIPRDDKPARYAWVANNYRFFGAPVGVFFVIDRNLGRGQWAHLGMFMQSVALAATARGLGTCFQESWAMVRKSLHTHFELADDEILYCGMALGWPDEDAPVNRLRSDRVEVGELARFLGFDETS